MFLRGFAIAAVISVFGMGCGGTEQMEGVESGEQLGQDSSELNETCEVLQTRTCIWDSSRSCYWSNGALGECYCQGSPNPWFCWVSD